MHFEIILIVGVNKYEFENVMCPVVHRSIRDLTFYELAFYTSPNNRCV